MGRLLLLHVFSFICFWTVKDIFAAEENLATCQQFLTDVRLTNTITIGQHHETHCPCFEQKVALDYSFHKDGNCYKQWFSEDKIKQKCCYDSNGNILLGPKNGGYAIPDSLEPNIEEIHDTCCTDNVMCKRFYELFPSDNCSTNTRHIEGEGKMTCQEFTADISLRNLIDIGQTKAQPCPCIEQIIAIDYTFEKKKNCYRQWLFTDDVKQVCCYSDNGQLILDGPGAGYLLLKSKEDYIDHAHDTCCRDGSITYDKTCRSFYQINPPDNCSSYVPPRVSLSSGDPMIQTIDGKQQYSFNGHGEYVFLTDNKTFEIQARTEYVVKGNHDSTYFSAFAWKDINSTEEIELHYNKDSKVIQLYRNGKRISNCNSNVELKTCGMGRYKCSAIAGNNRILLLGCRFPSYVENMEFSTDNFMTVTIKRQHRPNTANNLMGLAGDTENGSYIMRNSSTVSVNGSELQLFEFAETWSLQNENESIFRYNETGGNYTLYNHHHTRPEFLEDKLGNLTELFEGYSEDNITKFNQTCRNYWNNEHNNQCLLTIARTKNYTLGLAVMREANATRHDYEILHNKAPKFTNDTPTFLNVSYGITEVLNLTEYARDDFDASDKIQYRVITNLTEYNIVNGVFNWTVDEELRYDDFSLTFILNDTSGFTAQHDMNIFYCGCEQNSQCDYSLYNTNSSATVKKALCNCPEYTSGLYCEIEEDPCMDYHCYTTCNRTLSRTLPSWPCEECPKGRRYKNVNRYQTCENIDECKFNETNPCDHTCNDTDGSYNCSCTDGYKLNVDKHTCDDIDECHQDKIHCTKENEVCYNTPGNYSCICRTDYVRNNDKNCVKTIGGSYAGSIEFKMIMENKKQVVNITYNSHKYKQIVQNNLTSAFNGTYFIGVDVVRLIVIQNQNDSTHSLNATVIVHMKNQTKNGKYIKMLLDQSLKKHQTDSNLKLDNDVSIRLDLSSLNISSVGLCTIPEQVECDLSTTKCKDLGGFTRCLCKTGFNDIGSTITCKDIDECTTKKNMTTDLCVHGKCDNTEGSWSCICDDVYKHHHDTSYGKITRYRCEGDFKYIGQLKIFAPEEKNETFLKEFLNNTIAPLFSQRKIKKWIDQKPHMPDIVWKIDFLNWTGSDQTYIIKYILHIGESVTTDLIREYQKDIIKESKQNIIKDTNIIIYNASIFEESGFNLCNVSNKTKCDMDTTLCKVYNGSYSCQCKTGYKRRLNNPYQCEDINECKWKNMTKLCKHGKCINTEGSWGCFCINKSHQYYKDIGRDGLKKIRCEGEYQYIGKVYLEQEYYVNSTRLQSEVSGLYQEATTVIVSCFGDSLMLSDIFKNVDNINITKSDNYTQTALYVLHIGESVPPACLNDILDGINGTHGVVNATILNETGFNICDIEDLKLCDRKTTRCEVKNGAHTCPCKDGFKREIEISDSYRCEDVNECSDNKHYCYNKGECKNTQGNWTCICQPGFEPVRYGEYNITCQDIKECDKPNIYKCDGATSNAAQCKNTEGNWDCSCNDGFKPRNITQNARICEDIDECKSGDFTCRNGACVNTIGNWSCTCNEGFTNKTTQNEGKHVICNDINECQTPETACIDAIGCDNLPGTWQCRCNEGLEEITINKTSKQCRGEYLYVASMSFSLIGKITNVEKLQNDIKNKILDIYKKEPKFKDAWIEILSISGLSKDIRKKRSIPSHEISIEYIIHTKEEKTQDQLKSVDTNYKKDYCTNKTCTDSIDGYPMTMDHIVPKNESAICDTRQNVCDTDISTCNSTNGKMQCACNEGYKRQGDKNSLLCHDIDECRFFPNWPCEKGRQCINTEGSFDCGCDNGFKAIGNATFKKCQDPCLTHDCHITSICQKADTNTGYTCQCKKGRKGTFCKEIDHEYANSKQQTLIIALASSLGGSILILIIAICAICRWRTINVNEAEKISMKRMDSNGSNNFNGSFLTNQYLPDLPDRDDDAGSFYSRRLSRSSLPYVHQNGVSGGNGYSGNQDGHVLNSKAIKLPRLKFHGSMPNLAYGGSNLNQYNIRRYSGEGPKHMHSYDQDLNQSLDFDRRASRNNWNGRRSPSPDYERQKSPKADYGRPNSPKPDYHQARKHYRSRDSGVGNGNSSGSNEYKQPERRRYYFYGQRQTTNF